MTFHFSLQLDPRTAPKPIPSGRLHPPPSLHNASSWVVAGLWCYTLPLQGVLPFAFCPGAAHPIYALVDRFPTHR